MIIYRLAGGAYKDDLSGNGAKLFGGRWNSAGKKAVYCSEHISLALLEILVNMNLFKQPNDYHLVTIAVPDSIKPVSINAAKLKKNWQDDIGYSRFMGNEFLKNRQSLLLKVPSAIVEPEHNLVINPDHPDVSKVKIISTKLFTLDKRLLLKND